MVQPEILSISYGLGAAVTWGGGDFSGGLATKKGNVLVVILYSQVIGFCLLLGLQWGLATDWPQWHHCAWGALAGLCGAAGLVALYKGLAGGRMGIVAPLSAVVTALVPLVFAFFTEGPASGSQMIGFAGALVAVWFLSATPGSGAVQKTEWGLSILAGCGFGLFFICIDRVSGDAILWPLVAARMASVSTMLAILLVRRQKMTIAGRGQFAFIAMAGVLDTAGNALFALASQLGRLDVSAVLVSMYPAATVLLARLILNEQWSRPQKMGMVAALGALGLIAL